MSEQQIDARALTILRALVERYISDGQPVGSKALAGSGQIVLSPASVRHIMAELEAGGFLSSPHTSAGRIPTPKGFRLFVDSLLTSSPLNRLDLPELESQLSTMSDRRKIIETASNALSRLTHLAGVVSLPKRQHDRLTHVEFLPLSGARVLVILVFNEKEVQNRIITVEQALSASELQQAGNYLTQQFAGKPLIQVRQALLEDMQHDRLHIEAMLKVVLSVADEVIDDSGDCVLAGEANLLEFAEETGFRQLRNLFNAFNHKSDILSLLDQCLQADGLQIFIGSEANHEVFQECSLVTAPYKVKGELVGVLGVIGPTRMAYERVIPTVDVTAKLLSAALSD